MRIFCVILFFLLQASAISAKENYRFRTLSPEGGFYYDGVIAIQQDQSGFIWVLIDNELCRFDGYQYKRYSSHFKPINKTMEWSFYNIVTDSKGKIFVSTNNGIYLYDKDSDTFNLIGNIKVDGLKIDENNNIWVKKNKEWSILDLKTGHLNTPLYDGKGLPYIGSAFCINNDDVYVFSNYGKIFRYNPNKNKFLLCLTLPEKDGLVTHARAYKGKLWVLVQKYGLYKINLSTFTIEAHFDLFKECDIAQVRSFLIDKNGNIWLGTINGLHILNPETKECSHYLHSKSDPFSIPNNSVWTMSEDQQKNIWIGTYSGGLCYVNLDEKMAFKTYFPQENQLSYSPVSAFAEDNESLWIGTEGGGLNRMNKKTKQFTYYTNAENKHLAYNHIKSLVVDKKQNLWISMYTGGLDYLNIQTNHFRNFKHNLNNSNSLLSSNIRKIILEGDSGLWIAYQQGSLDISFYSFKNDRFTHYNLEKKNKGYYFIFDILKGQGNQLWIVSSEKLYQMNIDDHTVKAVLPKDSIFPNFHSFCLDDSGNLWLGTTGNGLLKYNPNTFECTSFKEILNRNINSIYSICHDDEGNLWMGTDNGLIRYNISKNEFSRYDKNDGVQGQVYYPLACMKGFGGELYFGGTNGFTVIDPKNVTNNVYLPRIIISDFLIDQESSGMNFSSTDTSKNEIILEHDQINFGFKFSSNNYLIPEKNRFKYRLKGYNDNWTEVDASNRTALYFKVPVGIYYFEVLAANNDGLWNDAPTVIKIIRKPPIWLSWPAYLLYSILFVLIAYLIFRYYSEKKKLKIQLYLENIEKGKKEEIHQTQLLFFTNISHDFRTPLSLIMATVSRLREEGLKEYYYKILNSNSERLLNLVNELMDFRTVENGKMKLEVQLIDDLNAFLEKIASDFSDYAKQRNIQFKIMHAPSLPSSIYIDKNIIEKVVMNLLNNAFKYTKDRGSVSIEIYSNSNTFTSQYENNYTVHENSIPQNTFAIVVRDSGVGISKESIASVFERFYKTNTIDSDSHLGTGIGLALVKSLVLLHKGFITIFSERGRGTDMIVCLPLGRDVYEISDFLEKKFTPQNEKEIESLGNIDEILEENVLLRDRKRILLAEDNNDLRYLIAESLSDYYEVIEASDGLVASKYIHNMAIDLIISDIMMPFKDGITLCDEVKNDINTSHIPFIMLTAKTSIESKIEGVNSGADLYFEKPVDIHFLKLSIENVFKHQQQLKEYYAKNYFVDSAELSSNQQDNKFLNKFIEVLEKNLDQSEMDVNYIASTLSMSRSKLYTKVKSLTDKSIVEFILSYRLRKAARLIIEEDMSMREIMNQIGIESQSYFTNAFKKEFGDTPTSFASKHKNPKK